MRKIVLALLAAAVTVGFGMPQTARADGRIIVHRSGSVHFGNAHGLGNRWAWGPFSLNRSLGYIPTPPYFALHPPVYYSHPVAVPYGMSPYPIVSYSPMFRTHHERPTPEPQVVINPYVEDEATTDAEPGIFPQEAAIQEAEETSADDIAQPVMKIVDAAGSEISPATQPAVIENRL